MATIDTTTSTSGLAFCNGRHIARTSTGRIWVGFNNATQLEFWYSDDDGASFTQNTSATISTVTAASGFSFFIDIDNHAHVLYNDQGSATYRRMASISTGTSWASLFRINFAYNSKFDIVAFRDGASWVAVTAATYTSNTNVTVLAAVDSSPVIDQTLSFGSTGYVSLDFNHTGDGKSIAGAAPHIYAVGISGANLNYKKMTYSGGTYSVGATRVLDSVGTKLVPVNHAFDGTRSVIAYAEGTAVYIAERDAADTTTTLRTPTALSDGAPSNVSVSYDSDGAIHLWAVGTTSDDLKRIKFDRSAGTWDGSWTTVHTGTAVADSLTLKRGYSDATMDAVFLDGASSPYDVVYESLTLNAAPTAPTWDTAAGTKDVNASLLLDWTFNDPDGDASTAYALQRSVDGGSVEWWTGSAWGTETKIVTTDTSLTLASSWATLADSIVYKVKGYDAVDVVSPLSAGITIVAGEKVNPTVTLPTAAQVINTGTITPTWICTSQSKYTLRLLSAVDAELFTTGQVTSTSSRAHSISYALSNLTTYKIELTTVSIGGVTSDVQTVTFSTSFTPPTAPTLTATADSPVVSAVTVAIDQGTPTETVSYHDLYRREATVGGDGIRIATAVAVDGSVVSYTQRAGTAYEYKVISIGENLTETSSAWT
jgi:hypothetical protein